MIQNGNFYISASEFWHYFYKHRDSHMLLTGGISDVKERERLFNEFVAVVYIELSAYCNRKCSYCPMSLYPREQKNMDETLFEKAIKELEYIDYRNTISLSHFNEPLADEMLVERIREIHSRLPYCYIRFNSNGDYLTKEMLEQLGEAGLKEIQITMHFAPGEVYEDDLAKDKIDAFFRRVGIPYEIKAMRAGHNITVDFIYNNVRMLVLTNNWAEDGNSRGGVVESLNIDNRVFPCATPFRELVIDVEGDMRRCSNMFYTEESMGNLKDISMVDFFLSEEMTRLRRNLIFFNQERVLPCNTCNTFDYSQNWDSREWNNKMQKRYQDVF